MSDLLEKLRELVRTETFGFHPRLHAVSLAASLLPRRGSGDRRTRILRLAGFRIGRGTQVRGLPRISGRAGLLERLDVGDDCSIDLDCVLDLEEHIRIGNRVTLGPGVMILTSTHELASAEHRAGVITRAPVTLRDGCLVGARAIVLPGVTLGEGAIVEPGAVVNKDVAPNTRVGGIPAMPLETLATA
jgi:maltose O-acetyltransferase